MGETKGVDRPTADPAGRITVRLFGMLHTMRREAGLPATVVVDVPEDGVVARELAQRLGLPLKHIEGVFCNGDVFGLSRVLGPGDRVAFVPYGTPGPHRVFLGLYKAGREDDGPNLPSEEE